MSELHQIKDLIGENKIDSALDLLILHAQKKNSQYENDLIALKAEYNAKYSEAMRTGASFDPGDLFVEILEYADLLADHKIEEVTKLKNERLIGLVIKSFMKEKSRYKLYASLIVVFLVLLLVAAQIVVIPFVQDLMYFSLAPTFVSIYFPTSKYYDVIGRIKDFKGLQNNPDLLTGERMDEIFTLFIQKSMT